MFILYIHVHVLIITVDKCSYVINVLISFHFLLFLQAAFLHRTGINSLRYRMTTSTC